MCFVCPQGPGYPQTLDILECSVICGLSAAAFSQFHNKTSQSFFQNYWDVLVTSCLRRATSQSFFQNYWDIPVISCLRRATSIPLLFQHAHYAHTEHPNNFMKTIWMRVRACRHLFYSGARHRCNRQRSWSERVGGPQLATKGETHKLATICWAHRNC